MSAAVDHAPAIAAGLVENRASLVPGFSLRAYVAEHWPAASEEELVRGARIALESIDGMLAEMDAGLDRVRPPEIRDCVADVKRELCRLVYAEDVPGVLWRLGRRWPVLTWPVFLEGVMEAMAHMEPGQDDHEPEDGNP